MKKTALAIIVAGMPALSQAADSRPLVPLLDAAAVTKNCDDALAQATKTVAAMEAKKGAGAIFDEWNRLQIQIEDTLNPIYLLGSVHPDKAVRDASEPCLQKFTTFSTDLFQNEALFKRTTGETTDQR